MPTSLDGNLAAILHGDVENSGYFGGITRHLYRRHGRKARYSTSRISDLSSRYVFSVWLARGKSGGC